MVPMRILYPGRNFIWVQALLVICIAWISTVTGQEGTTLEASYTFEVIYFAYRSTLNLCLLRYEGPTFISALELRKLANGMYAAAVGPSLNNYMNMLDRVNCGPNETGSVQFWRYPDDAYDRVWYLPGSNDNATHLSNRSAISGSSNSFAEDPDRPPLVVMETGWIYYPQNILWVSDGFTSPLGISYSAAYVQELDGNASATNVRGMNFVLNGDFIETFNSSDKPKEVYAVHNITDPIYNMSLVQTNWSLLVPILNAYEVYQMYTYDYSATADSDVSALYSLQARLNLTDWTGDPCLPTPFDWLTCSQDGLEPRITNLSLASHGFGGSIPLEIVNLTALTILDLDNNSFSGSIPDFSKLESLQSIYLQNNNLSGEIPSFLGTAFPNLTQLNLDNNNLSGTVPLALHKQGLNFTYAHNPQLITPSWINSTSPVKSSSSGTSIGAVVGGIIGGLVAIAVIVWIVWMLCTRKSRARSSIIRAIGNAESRSPLQQELSTGRKALEGSALSLQEVSDATKKFSRKIGEGSFGLVYYGKLPNGQEVAVKVKSTDSRQGGTEFSNEVELLSRIHHRNLVSLVGFCEEGNQQIIIYVYVSNGTLRDHLYGDKARKPLNWRTRLDIALNAARGIEYLHTDCNPRIIHRDVKSSNILIDENMVAKVCDFGISKQTPEGIFSGVDTLLKGTPGYFDPEYFISQRLTQKSDVYSFGVVLLEIISGRHPHVSDLPDGSSGTLIQWVRIAANDGRLLDIVDPTLNGEFNVDSMMRVISLAISSIDLATAKRPDMRQVVRSLTEAIELELFSEIIKKTDEDTPSIAEDKDEGKDGDRNEASQRSDFSLSRIPETEVPVVDPESIVLPR
ncbi:unnamed protein product [Calypogeia fissa]